MHSLLQEDAMQTIHVKPPHPPTQHPHECGHAPLQFVQEEAVQRREALEKLRARDGTLAAFSRARSGAATGVLKA